MYNKDLITKIIPSLSFKFPYNADDYSEHMYFENYHKHTDSSNYGLADSGECYPNYIKRIKELNSKCLFSGEHGWQGDHISVYDLAQSEQLKYRHSAEVYWVKDRFEKDKSNCHMIIVAKTAKGRRRLNYLISMANIDGYYMKPRIDLSLLLAEDPNGFIVTSACIAGWKYPDADDIWLKVAKHFGKNFFFELQYHNTDRQKELNTHILDLSRKHGIDIICGLDSHYVGDEGMIKRKMMLLYKYNDENYYSDEIGWYMDFPDVDTIISRFKEQGVLSEEEIYRAIMNTNVFVNDCEEIVLDKKFKIPNIYPELSYEERVKKYHSLLNEAYKKEPVKSKERVAGIKMEAKEVTSSGVVDYFLFNHALIDLAVKKYNGKITTTSRGSMGSFYTNKLLGYTTLDRFNSDVPMYPERFITAERVLAGQMPDCDFNIAEQPPFVNAAKELLGEHGCYPLMTIEKLKVKSAWKLYSKANGVSPSDSDAVSKCIDAYLLDLKHTNEEDRDSINVEDYISEEYIDLYRKSIDYQKITINLKAHPCFTKDNLVLTDKGYKPIVDVQIGDFVLTHDNSYQQVLDKQVKKSNDLYKIKVFGDEVEATGNHKFYVATNIGKPIKKLSEPYWKELSKIDKNDWIGSPINQNSIVPTFSGNNKTWKSEFVDLNDPDFWWMIGRYMGDGWTEYPREGDYRVFICCNKNNNEVEDIVSRIPKYFKYRVEEHRTVYKIIFNNKVLFDYLQQFGKYAYGKKLTNDIIDLPVDLLKEFLSGYLSADGHKNKNGSIGFTTVSRELALGIQQCVHKVYKRPCTITTQKEGIDIIEGRTVNRRKKYRGRFKLDARKKDVNVFAYGCVWFKVKDVWKEDKEDTVYNLSVNESNSYTVNNLSVHNCGQLVFSGDIREEIGLVSAISENTNKRTICACVQGGYLDAYGYVKDDFLIVDAVSLTNEFFESIGQPVPTFEELKTMVKGDNLTWDIYEKGITCCVNQLEKESTSNKMKKYKAKNITELSSFIAAIRPSFAPLLNTFLNRQEYSIGEEGLDNLLEDTAHFILYQESIMKILSYLSVSMSETYGVIKAISKKKLKGEKKAHLEEQLRKGWMEQFGNLDRFNEVWQVIEASASYGFNSAHAYSMAGDSLYQAWFKAHHTAKFYEVAMNHYYRKDSKDKIMALSVEAVECFGYKKLPFKFRQDNRGFVVNGEDKTISMCLSSIKGMSKEAANILYALKDKEYKSFLDFLKQENLPKNIIEPLITLDYFSEFGKTKYLKDIYELYQTRYDKDKFKKIIKKDKNIYIDAFVRKYAKETEKQYTITDEEGFMNELISKIPNEHLPLEQLLKAQYEMTGVIQNVNPKLKGIYFICDINTKYSPVVLCIDLGTGETKRFKMKKRDYEMSTIAPFKLMLCQTNPQPRKRKTETGWEETGEMDEWITKFKIRG